MRAAPDAAAPEQDDQTVSGHVASPGRDRGRRLRAVATRVAVAGAWLQIFVGVGWWWRNVTTIPAYGDTQEYVALSQTLKVDSFRTVAYPVAVRIARDLGAHGPVPWQTYLYVAQLLAAACAALYLVRTLSPRATAGRQALATAAVATTPLVLHYSTSVLSDAFASAFFVLALTGAARMAVRDDRRASTIALTASCAALAALMRAEKAAVLLVWLAVIAVCLLVARRRTRRAAVAAVAVLCLAVAAPAVVAAGINKATQTADLGRPRADSLTSAVNRVVWPHLRQIQPELDPTLQTVVTPELAASFDADNNAVIPLVIQLRSLDGGGDRYTREVVRLALRCCWRSVAAATAFDAAEYAVTPLTFGVEGTQTLALHRTGTVTAWDVSRFDAADPAVSKALFGVGLVELAALALAAAVNWMTSPSVARRRVSWMALAVFAGTVLNGIAFALVQGSDANVRYGLGNAIVGTTVLAAWGIAVARPEPGTRGRSAPVGEGLVREQDDLRAVIAS